MKAILLFQFMFLCHVAWAASYLNSDQIAHYQNEGFLVIRNFISESECDELQHQARKIIHEHGPLLSAEVFQSLSQGISQEMHYLNKASNLCLFFNEKAFSEDGHLCFPLENAVTKISHALHDIDPLFSAFSHQAKIAALVSDLGLANPLLVQSMMIIKQANSGDEVSCHQDGTYVYTEPDTTIGLWFALEDALIENGCLWLIPKGHFTPLKYRFIVTSEQEAHFINLDDSPWEVDKMVPVEVPKGSLIVLHSRIPHMSKANLSSASRPAYTLHLIDASSHYPSENWLQREESVLNKHPPESH